MEVRRIHSRDNARFKAWKQLTTSHGRKKAGGFLVESRKLVVEFLFSGRTPDALLFREGQREALCETMKVLSRRFASLSAPVDLIKRPPCPQYELSEALFRQLTTLKTEDGVLLVASGTLSKPLTHSSALGHTPLLVLDGLQDPGNVGAILRSAEAFGYPTVLGLDCVEFEHPRVLRAAMGSAFRLLLHTAQYDTFSMEALGTRTWIGADMDGTDYRSFSWNAPFALVIGNEGRGVRPELREQMDQWVSIPMEGAVESLNAAVSASLLMAQSRKNEVSNE